ncbi:Clathrin light chain Short=CLC [Rhizoctonia solani AG-1 IB]|uniref:Clathrin light chain n=1 Tax=Thanatephorus cucumeris (strain AG1-IB / isolate 7/3/14) TaxID=1108050 RepID=M5CF02_THACB|nr:Clathrin light chain Short=CLC [Rhizoctonia solani AG-1 IB]
MLSNRLDSDVRCNSQGPLDTALSAGLGATIFPALDDDFGDPAPVPVPVQSISGAGHLDEFERPAGAFPALDGDEGISAPSLKFDSQPSFDATPQVPSSFQSLAPPQFQSPVPQGPNYSAFARPEVPEPEVVRQWREDQAEKIAQRDEESKRKRQETIARAEKEIDKLYEDYNSKKERTIRENKENKAEFLSSLTDSLLASTTWSRICDLIDLENSQSNTVARPGVDLTRYREVLLKLRKQGDKAPGAAGY